MTTHRLYQYLIGSLITLILIIGSPILTPIALGQLPSFPSPSTTQPLPPGVVRRGTLESFPVRLDNRELFRIASPTVLNRSDPGTQIPVEARAKQVESNLAQVVNSSSDEANLDPETMQVVSEIFGGQPVLYAKAPNWTDSKVLLTVTDADAQFYSTNKNNLARQWQAILERELRQALRLRQPEVLQAQITRVVTVLIGTVLLTLLLGIIWSVLGRRKHRLKQQQVAEQNAIQAQTLAIGDADTTEVVEPNQHVEFPELQEHFGIERRLQTLQFFRWFLFWAIALIWIAGIAYSFSAFPQTRYISRRIVTIPIVLLITWFVTGFINRLTDLLADRFIQSREREQSLTRANLQRITTIARVVKGLKMVLLYTVSLLWVLQWLNLASGAVLTLGAVLALAVSLAAQNLIKDIVNGFLILIEDQFRIGDMVKVGTTAGLSEVTGLVENLNLRLTQLRSPAGNLITIPNSTIAQVENMSRNWARADFQIEVSYNTDVDRALEIVRETIDQMAADPMWQSLILDTREVFGVEQLAHTGIMIRVWIKTLPLKQWDVGRELRRRLKIAFDYHHIQIGIPQQLWQGNNTSQIIT